jgi:hypothetical protein
MDDLDKYLPTRTRMMRTLKNQLLWGTNKPYIGLTQGGSSRPDPGCRQAARKALVKQPKGEVTYE